MFNVNIRSAHLKITIASVVSVAVLFFILNYLFPLKVDIKYSQVIISSEGKIIHAFLSEDDKWRMMIDKNEISPSLEKAILYKEDHFFYYHPGINPFALLRAAWNNIASAQRTSGASTITMQVARLLYPKERTYLNKLIEMFRAVQLEMKYSKSEILKMYLTLVPYGGNIEGIKAASYFYFESPCNKLSLSQIAMLCVIPNRPNSLRPDRGNSLLVNARNKWLKKMNSAGLFSDDEVHGAFAEPVQVKRRRNSDYAQHFSLLMHKSFPDNPIVHSSINTSVQDKISSLAYNYSKRLKSMNINNASVLVIDNKTNSIVAYLGSADYNDSLNAGEVDGIQAIRSPGSTLKPFIYALSFDEGLLTPKSVIADVPVNYDGYAPENYNSTFNGNVTIEQSLSNSLNIPAVRTLNQIGIHSFINKLSVAGFKQVAKDDLKLGLAAALGGCGVSLFELTSLYSSLARDGKFSPPQTLDTVYEIKDKIIFSPSSCYMISDILSKSTRPDLPENYESNMHVPKIAWKTGTSYGRRDAWSIGYNSNYTVGVWIGNFSGEGVAELSGSEIATPLLFKIFNSIDYNSRNSWFRQPHSLDVRLVCSESGNCPSDFCENQIIDYYIPGVSSNQKCTHRKMMYISPDENISYCTSCLPDAGYKMKLYQDINSELISFYNAQHIAYSKIPPHNLNCSRIFADESPVITSPLNKKEYLIEKNDKNQKILLSCYTDNEVKTIYWYVNDQYYSSCASDQDIFFTLSGGNFKISCSDDKGRNTDIWIVVNYI